MLGVSDSPSPASALSAPPSWLPLYEAQEGDQGADGTGFPGESWPQLQTIEYISKLILLVLLLLGLPWLFAVLLSHPSRLSAHAAAMGPAPVP